jgi:UDP:flavonoid glycosyltransferase YjiC (YdhE family)
MPDVLIATWLGGGAMHNALRIGRELVARGHSVRVSAPRRFVELTAEFGCVPVPHPADAEFDPALGRAMDDQSAFMKDTFFGSVLADAIRMEATRHRPDVVLVDYLLRSVEVEVEALDLPAASLMTMRFRPPAPDRDPDAEWGWRWQYDQVNAIRAARGLAPLPVSDEMSATFAQACRAKRVLATMPREFDSWPSPPDNVVYVGPINESRTPAAWHSPWDAVDDRPLVVVTLGTMYMGQEAVIERILDALEPASARILVLTGDELEPGELTMRRKSLDSGTIRDGVRSMSRALATYGGAVAAADAIERLSI